MTTGRFPLLALALIAACHRTPPREEVTTPEVTAETAVATVRPFHVRLGALGTMAASPAHVARLGAPAATGVTRVLVAPGDRVTAGQALVELDATIFLADVRRAEAAQTAARREYDRVSDLTAAGILARKDADSAAAALADANANLVKARYTLSLAVIRTPIQGVVTRMDARVGAPVDPAQVLVEVIDPRGLEVRVTVPPEQAATIRPGAPVLVTSGRDTAGPPLGAGEVTGVGAAIDTTSGSVDVRAALQRLTGTLFVDQDVYATIQVAVHPAAVTIPPEALVPRGTGVQVFVVDTGGVAHARPVTVGARSRDAVEIIRGLKGGERVVTRGAYGVQDGARIRRAPP